MGHPTIEDVQAKLAASGRELIVVGAGVAIAATAGTLQAAARRCCSRRRECRAPARPVGEPFPRQEA
jgi:hypothetical protein